MSCDNATAEQRQLHARQALRDAVTHRWYTAGELRHRAGLTRRHLDQRRKTLERLVRRQHVVVGRYDGDVGPHQRAQRLLVIRVRGCKAMGEIGAAQAAARRATAACRLHAREVIVPGVPAARPDTLGHLGDAGVQRCDRKFMLFHWCGTRICCRQNIVQPGLDVTI
jgi:hypothetical protein